MIEFEAIGAGTSSINFSPAQDLIFQDSIGNLLTVAAMPVTVYANTSEAGSAIAVDRHRNAVSGGNAAAKLRC